MSEPQTHPEATPPSPFAGAQRAEDYVERTQYPSQIGAAEEVPAAPEEVLAEPEAVQLPQPAPEQAPAAAAPAAPAQAEERRTVDVLSVSGDLTGSWFTSGVNQPQPGRPNSQRARQGMRGVFGRMGFNVAPGKREQRELDHQQMLAEAETSVRSATWPGAVGVLVANRKGGVGKTPVALGIGGILASIRGGSVAILEVSDDPGMLALRSEGAPRLGLGDLMRDSHTIHTAGQLAAYTAPQTSHAAVIGSPRPRPNLTGEHVERISRLLDVHYSMRIMDSGNVYTSSAFAAAAHYAHALVIPVTDSADSMQDALSLIQHLSQTEQGHRLLSSAVIVRLRNVQADAQTVRMVDDAIASTGIYRVVDVPADPHIAARGELSLAQLRPETRNAFLLAAAHVVSAIPRY